VTRGNFQKNSSMMLEGPIGKTLIRLALPMVFGMAAIILFNVIDTFYVGRLGATQLAAMSFTFPVVYMLTHLTVGLGVGVTSVIARAIGEGDPDRVKRLTTDGLILANTVVIVLAIVGLLSFDPLFRALGAGDELRPLIRDYMLWLYGGIGFLVIPIVGNSAIRATGDTKTPAIIMAVAGLVNIALDPLLIFGIGPFPRLELQGAAIATVISWAVTFGAALYILDKRLHMIDWKIPRLSAMLASWKAILYVGVPAAATQMIVPFAAGVITRIVSAFGPEAVAAFGVGTRIEALALIGFFSIGAALSPFMGQNYGARKFSRLRGAMEFSAKASVVFGLAIYAVLAVLARPLASIFTDKVEVIDMIANYLYILPLGYMFHGYALLIVSTFNAINRPITSVWLNIFRVFVLGIPLAYLGARVYGVNGIFAGVVLANVAIGIAAFVTVRKFLSICRVEMKA